MPTQSRRKHTAQAAALTACLALALLASAFALAADASKQRHEIVLRRTIAHLHSTPFATVSDGSLDFGDAGASWYVGEDREGVRNVTVVTRIGSTGPGGDPRASVYRLIR